MPQLCYYFIIPWNLWAITDEAGFKFMRKKTKVLRGGYWYILNKSHPNSGKQGYIAIHQLVMEKYIGRYLRKGEVVHHINHNKLDNRIDNLQLFASHGQHTKLAHPEIAIRNKTIFKGKSYSVKTEFKKGNIPWNFNTKGVMKAWNKGLLGFRKGHPPTNTKPNKTSFKKGLIPWNKGKRGVMPVPWNKGLQYKRGTKRKII